MDLGIGWSSILRKVSNLALDLHNANKNLKKLCACLADQEWIERYNARKLDLAKRVRNFRNDMIRMPCYLEEVQVGNVIRPMLSKRSSCPTALDDMERLNEEFIYLEKQERHLKSLLPIKFPTFIAEVKLDGERMIVHVQRGEVTMHVSVNYLDYSFHYSPS
jgi:ATP-dependent DNA ligase